MIIFCSPGRYVQGPHALDAIVEHVRPVGLRPLAVVDHGIGATIGRRIETLFAASDLSLLACEFSGEITQACVDGLLQLGAGHAPDVVIGVGGGKALDAAKAVAHSLGLPCCMVPTIASTDAPASYSIALYNEQHELVEVRKLPRNPELVLVDTAVICAAPLRFLRAGIGDAISKKFEAEACLRAGALTLQGAQPSHTGMMAARLSFDLIREHGVAALGEIAAGSPGAHAEALIEATVLLSTLSFENGGLSVAHAIARGVPMVARSAGSLHGEHVAYGLLVQLVLEDRSPREIEEIIALYRALGLPRHLSDLRLAQPAPAELDALLQGSMGSPSLRRFHRPLGLADLRNAILAVEAWDR